MLMTFLITFIHFACGERISFPLRRNSWVDAMSYPERLNWGQREESTSQKVSAVKGSE